MIADLQGAFSFKDITENMTIPQVRVMLMDIEELRRILETEDISENSRRLAENLIDLHEEKEAREEEDAMTEDDIDAIIKSISDEDILDTYDDDELKVVDDETGETLEESSEILEVLSRAERMKARVRFAKSKVKREIKARLALRRRSNNKTFANRARRAAIKAMKMKIAKKSLSQLSIAEKERLERLVALRKKSIDRIALKLTPRIKQIERDRLTHKTTQ